MKTKTKKLLALLLALTMLASVLAACGGSNAEQQNLTNEDLMGQNEDIANAENAGETGYIRDKLTIAFTGATSLTPWGTSNNTPGNFEVYECLFQSDIQGNTYPVLADATRGEFSGYDHEEGSAVYTVYIWDYIYDHNGNHVTADDVKFSYDYSRGITNLSQ